MFTGPSFGTRTSSTYKKHTINYKICNKKLWIGVENFAKSHNFHNETLILLFKASRIIFTNLYRLIRTGTNFVNGVIYIVSLINLGQLLLSSPTVSVLSFFLTLMLSHPFLFPEIKYENWSSVFSYIYTLLQF